MSTRPEVGASVTDVNLAGRTVLVTGATSGIGRETALALGRLGARVLVHGRNRERGQTVVRELEAAGAEGPLFFEANFLSLNEVHSLAVAVKEHVSELDVLVNNAGAHFQAGGLTQEGVERTFVVNHLAPFLLTNRLLPTIPPGGRVVTVASDVHRRISALDLQAVQSIADYDGLEAYSRSKLANVMFTLDLARRLGDRTATCLHPGFVPGSAIWRDASLPVRAVMAVLRNVPPALTGDVIETPAQAAETSVYLAASPDVADVTGRYFDDCEPVEPSSAALDERSQHELWRFSEKVCGLEETEIVSR